MQLESWALRHGVSHAALHDLKVNLLRLDSAEVTEIPGMSEGAVQARIRLEAPRKHIRLWRNNVGACKQLDEITGKVISVTRYGLANDSAALNKVLKSADLIGIRPVLITAEHVGRTVGQFVSREVKAGGWRFTGDAHEVAQQNWANLVNACGGDASFANSEGTL